VSQAPYILALVPDARQAGALKDVVESEVKAEITVVDSRDAAMAALSARVPDVILLTALLSPRDEEELIGHLRTLDGIDHVQTHTLPMLAVVPVEEPSSGGLFGRLLGRKTIVAPAACDPVMYAEEIRSYLARAADMRQEHQSARAWSAAQAEAAAEPEIDGIQSEVPSAHEVEAEERRLAGERAALREAEERAAEEARLRETRPESRRCSSSR
jgi:hypothetical protein